MKYDSLQKLFFKQPNDYHSIYRNRFNSEYAIHLDFDKAFRRFIYALQRA